MSKRTCTETRPCNLTTCYGCARKLIDDLAGHMLDQGASQDKVDAFRYPAINALASHVITVPAPVKPKARKASTPKTGVDYQVIADKLRVCGSRAYAAELLVGRTIPELHHIATVADCGKLYGKLKADVLGSLIERLVGYRLDTNAILNAK